MRYPFLIIMAALPSTAFAAEWINFSGKTDIAYVQEFEGGTASKIKNNRSHLAIHGSMKTPWKVTPFYRTEWVLKDKNMKIEGVTNFIGYAGARTLAGNLTFGKNRSLLDQTTAHLDKFEDQLGDASTLWMGDQVSNKSFAYYSPSSKGFSFATQLSKSGTTQEYCVLWANEWFNHSSLQASSCIQKSEANNSITRATAKFTKHNLTLSAAAQEQILNNVSSSGFLIGADYKIRNATLKSQYQTMEDRTKFTAGTDIHFNINTKVYITGSYEKSRDSDSEPLQTLAVGINLSF